MSLKTDVQKIRETLIYLRDMDLEGAVAGGWLRDIDNGFAPKDIDVFVLDECHNLAIEQELPGDYYWYLNYGAMRDDVVGVLKQVQFDLDPFMNPDSEYPNMIDVVMMKSDSWNAVTANFDVSVCQILCKLEGEELVVYASKSYNKFKEGGRIKRFLEVPTCDNHIARVREKFNQPMQQVQTGTDSSLVRIGVLTEGGIKRAT